jgi:PAS domain S-box-containing protein
MNLTTYKAIDPGSTIPEKHIPRQLNILTSPLKAKTMTSCAPTTTALSSTRKMGPDPEEMEELLQKYEARIRELEQENAKLRQQRVEIQKAKELYLKIFEDFPALIWRSGLDKMCDYFNRTWLEWTGKTLDQEFGNGWTEGVHKDDFDRCLETYVQAFDKREPFYMEYRLLDKHQQYRWIGDHGRPFYDLDGTFLGYIGSCYDITDNKQNEQKLVKLNATKDKFFSIVAHDLRNPIATFVSVSEMLMEDADQFEPQELQEIANQMHKDSKNTLLLLENLLDWSKTQSDEIKYQPTPLHLPDLCRQVVAQVELCALAKQIRVDYQDTVPDWTVSADQNMLKTVVRNLLMNAIKYTHPGGQIHILASEYDGGNTLLIQVRDTGVGMSEHQIQSLFSLPGERGRYTSTPGTSHEGGSGLGLVICRDFIHKHGGNIWVESQPGIGTTFHFTIPWNGLLD